MEKHVTNDKFLVSAIILLLYLPLLESYFGTTLWGLNWHSPETMDRIGNYLLWLKMLCVTIGLLLLIKNRKRLKELGLSTAFNVTIISLSCVVGLVQVLFLSLGIFFSSLLSSDLSDIHKEKLFDEYSIYVYTANPGAMGKAYHYFYIKCPKPFARYGLTQVKKLDWMREFDFEVKNSELLIVPKYLDEAVSQRVDLTKFNQC